MMRIKKWQLLLWSVLAVLAAGSGFYLMTSSAAKNFFVSTKAGRLHEQGRYDEAIETYQRLIAIDPDNGINYWNMAVAYLQKGDEVNAKKQVFALRKLHEDDLSSMLEDLIARNSD